MTARMFERRARPVLAGVVLILGLMAGMVSVHAGEIIAFEPGKALPPAVLQKLPMKGVIAEFLDPGETGLGKEVSYLLWREVLSAISDQAGAGVILARAPGEQRITTMLNHDYHQAALRIAESQGARMAVWGALDEQEGQITIEVFLSLLGDAAGAELALRLTADNADTGLAARIGRTKFNFAPVLVDRKTLFQRTLVSRANTVVRTPSGDRVLTTLGAGVAMRADGMRGRLFNVALSDGRRGQVDIASIELPPRSVLIPSGVTLRGEPREQAPVRATTDTSSTAEVLDMRVVNNGTWYRVAMSSGGAWVPAWRVGARYSLPAVYFVAGIYRYQLGRYAEAMNAFEQFTQSPGVEADNLSLSCAYQLVGASKLMAASRANTLQQAKGWEQDYANALRQTPLDAGVYALRGVAQLAVRKDLAAATRDFEASLQLDPTHADARQALRSLDAHAKQLPEAARLRMLRLPQASSELRGRLDVLSRQFK